MPYAIISQITWCPPITSNTYSAATSNFETLSILNYPCLYAVKEILLYGPEWLCSVSRGGANQPEVRQDLSVMNPVSRYAKIFLNVLIFLRHHSMPSGPCLEEFPGSEVNT